VAHHWLTSLAVALSGDEPPREVRLFARGVNPTRKGPVLFDAVAAQSVMREYAAHGVDIMIDLEHRSLDTESRNYDGDARAYGKLELRSGELWLTDIKWTPDGVRRLTEKTQRYVSPAFKRDAKTNRVIHVHNVAICAQPATDNAMPLVAASGAGTMDPKILKEALDAIEGGDSAKAMELLKALIASAAGAGEAPPAEMMDPAAEEEKKEVEQIAASARAITGKRSPAEVTAVLTALNASRTSATDMAAELTALKARALAGELRELMRAHPRKVATTKLEALVLASASVEEARTLIDALPEVVGAPLGQPEPPAHTNEIKLTDEDREVCRLTGTDPAKFLKHKMKAASAV
jgi:phage I-like protein